MIRNVLLKPIPEYILVFMRIVKTPINGSLSRYIDDILLDTYRGFTPFYNTNSVLK